MDPLWTQNRRRCQVPAGDNAAARVHVGLRVCRFTADSTPLQSANQPISQSAGQKPNHDPQSRGVTDAVCNRHAYNKEKREALMGWEERLRILIAA